MLTWAKLVESSLHVLREKPVRLDGVDRQHPRLYCYWRYGVLEIQGVERAGPFGLITTFNGDSFTV